MAAPKTARKTVRIVIPVQVARDGKRVDVYVPDCDRADKAFASPKARKAEEKVIRDDYPGVSVVWVEADIPIPDDPPPAPIVKGATR